MMIRWQSTRWLGWTAVVAMPFAILGLALTGITPDPVWQGTNLHFLIVSLTSFIALLMAIFMLVAASQLNDARVVFLSLAFLGIAGVFSVHGLTTPGALVPGMNPWIGFCARFAMLVGAFFFALSTVEWRPALERRIVALQRPCTLSFAIGLVIFAVVALGSSVGTDHSSHTASVTATNEESHSASAEYGGDNYGSYTSSPAPSGSASANADTDPGLGRFGFLVSAPVERAVTFATLLLSTIVVFRYFRIYRLSRIPLVTGFLVSAVFLFQAQFSLTYAPTWHASWWLYHVLLLGAFSATLTGMVFEYSRSG